MDVERANNSDFVHYIYHYWEQIAILAGRNHTLGIKSCRYECFFLFVVKVIFDTQSDDMEIMSLWPQDN